MCMLKSFYSRHILGITFVLITSVSFSKADQIVSSVFELYPNPYQLINFSINNKAKYETQIQNNLLNYLSNNCDLVKNKKKKVRFCDNYQTLQLIKSYKEKIDKLVEDQSLVYGENIYILSSLMASNFEMDFLLSQDQVSEEVKLVINYLKVRNQLANKLMTMTNNFFDIHPGINIYGQSTVVPVYYSITTSVSVLETLTRYLQVADCLPGQKLCNYYLYSLFEDYKKAVDVYIKNVLDPADQMLAFILNADHGNFSLYEERVWMKDISNSLDNNDYSYFLDKMLTSAGHVDDSENKFKSNYVQLYQFKKILNSDFSKIQEKAQKWKLNSGELDEIILISDQQNIPYRKELLILMTQEINQHKKIIVDQIMQLDEEVQDANF